MVWALRLVWLAVPLTVGPLFAAALDASDDPWRTGASIALWALWALGLGALLVPLPETLVATRLVLCGSVLVAVAAALVAPLSVSVAVGLGWIVASAMLSLQAHIGDRFVDGASYGDERRMLLRPPSSLLAGPLPVVGLAAVVGLLAGPILLLRGEWVFGALASAIGMPLAGASMRSLLLLARRWLVFVPTGVVVKDVVALQEPVLFGRNGLRFIGPALADTTATDLTGGAFGMPLELDLIAATEVPVREKVGPKAQAAAPVELRGLLVAPSLPGEALLEAERRKLPVH